MIEITPTSLGAVCRRRAIYTIPGDAKIRVSDEDADLAALKWRIMWVGPPPDYRPHAARDVPGARRRLPDGTKPGGGVEYLKRAVAARMGLSGPIYCLDGNPLNCQRGNLTTVRMRRYR